MEHASYTERDYAFGQAILTLRIKMGLTQASLAKYLGISRRSVTEWEAGNSYPKVTHFKHLITLAFDNHAFPAGVEAEAISALWQLAHQKVPLDKHWLSMLLNRPHLPSKPINPSPSSVRVAPPPSPLPPHAEVESVHVADKVSAPPIEHPRMDWGDALSVPTFYGREKELTTLCQLVLRDRCQMVSVLGMGGIGKSALVTNAMHMLTPHFQAVIFRSLRDAPSCESMLDECLQVLAPLSLGQVPADLDRRISLLLEQLRTSRVLLVMDNLETLLEEGDIRGYLRPDMQEYARLLRRIAETTHQSCLVLTSREKLTGPGALADSLLSARSLYLSGLDTVACEQLLVECGVVGSPQEVACLVDRYGGNPLALKIVAEVISDLFGGEIGQFLAQEDEAVFGRIADLLDEQFSRLSPLEQKIIYWLAIAREPITLNELQSLLVVTIPFAQVLESIVGLRRRSLIEHGQRPGAITLQPVVLEYVTTDLVAKVVNEIQQQQFPYLTEYELCQAQAKEYIRQTQERLLVAPVLACLQSRAQGRADVECQLCSLLDQLRTWDLDAQGYGPSNVVSLLRVLHGNLCGRNMSHLLLRAVHLRGVEMQDATLAGSLVRNCVFTETLDATWAVAISGDGRYWATSSRRGEIRLWKDGNQFPYHVWQAHTDTTYALAFSPDIHFLVSGSWDDTIKLWDLESGALRGFGWHPNGVLCLAFSPDGAMLVSGGNDAIIRLWEIRHCTLLQNIPHPGSILSLAWSPDGRLLASGGLDGSIRLWEIRDKMANLNVSPTPIAFLPGHANHVRGLAFSPDGKTLASASWDGTVKLWALPSVEVTNGYPYLLHTLTGHTNRVNRVVWNPDGRMLASCGFDHMIWLWDAQQHCCHMVLQGHIAGVNGLAFTPDSHSLLSSSEDGTLRLWDVISGQCLQIVQGYASSLFDLDWNPDGSQLVSVGTDTLVTIWSVSNKAPPKLLPGHRRVVFGVGWSPDDLYLASSAWDDAIYLWSLTSGICVEKLHDPDYPDTALFGVAWSPDGQRLASGTYMHGVLVWDIKAHSFYHIGDQTPTWIRHVAWSPDGSHLMGGGDDGNVYLWDASNGTLLQMLSGHHGVVTSIAWHPDGKQVVSAGRGKESGELFLRKIQGTEPVRIFVGNPRVVYALAWVPSGDLLISGGSDGMLRWWNTYNGECTHVCQAHHGAVLSLRMSPDGSRLASCGDDGAIMLWDLYNGVHLRTLRRDRPYERLDITGIRGLTEVQKAALHTLGAIER